MWQSETSTPSMWQLWILRWKSSHRQKSEDQEKVSITLKGVTGFKGTTFDAFDTFE